MVDIGGQGVAIAHDSREAPVPTDEGNHELRDLLISVTDEQDKRMLAWARLGTGSDVVGIGIDLCLTASLTDDKRGNRFASLLFTDRERELLSCGKGPLPLRRAQTFAAKEAAFKATSAPLRRWYETHDEDLFFEVRDFELWPDGVARGTARSGRAAKACEMLGIDRIEVSFAEYEEMALCVAVAFTGR